MTTATKKTAASIVLIIGLVLMLVGGTMAHTASTSKGTVDIQSIEWVNENGASMHAVLYIPESASAANPVPGIVANHGFTSNSEAMHLHAIEMSRRGYVVIALDAYGHGNSSYPDMSIEGAVINDMGHYSALQYLGRLPYVDTDNIGLIGHSMGSDCARFGALRAFQEKEAGNDNVIVPKSILLTSNSFKAIAADSTGSVLGAGQSGEKVDPINAYPVNYGTIFGQFDEFAGIMWAVGKGSEFKNSAQFAVGMGFEGADYATYYAYGDSTALSREEAIEAGNNRTLRVGFNPSLTHAFTLFAKEPVALALEFFDITLSNGELASRTYAYDDQIWTMKPAGGMIALIGLVMFIMALGSMLIKSAAFQGIVKPEGRSFSTLAVSGDKVRYVVLYILLSACAPLLYTWCSGLSLHNPFHGVIVPVKLPVSEYFQLPGTNGVVLMNIILPIIFLVVFIVLFAMEKKRGYTLQDAGLAVSSKVFLKSLSLAVLLFVVLYALVYVAGLFHVEFGAFKLVLMEMPGYKWTVYLKYLPFFLAFFIVHSLIVNNLTRINGAKEWVNMVLIVVTTAGGLILLQAYDLIVFKSTGVRGIPTVPFSSDPNALSGILLWGTIMILPVAAVISRFFYKKTGSIWVGAILNGLLVTFVSVCGTCIMLPA